MISSNDEPIEELEDHRLAMDDPGDDLDLMEQQVDQAAFDAEL